jgi:SAM-dependent methyltransferase
MIENSRASDYTLGNTEAEHERLIRQSARIAPLTERFFREAGIGPGCRVLDIGSGVGDVAMLAAQIVGPTGEVVGIERDPRTITRARARVLESGLANVTFTQSDVNEIATAKPFDAVVGRYILMYLPDPTAVLQALTRLICPGGVVAFLDVSWAPVISLAAGLPLWSTCTSLIVELFRRSGVNPEMGLALRQVFPAAGLPVPKMHMEVLLGGDVEFTRGLQDLLLSLRPKFEQCQLDIQQLGDFDTLALRLHAELAASDRVASWLAIVSAWSRKLAS